MSQFWAPTRPNIAVSLLCEKMKTTKTTRRCLNCGPLRLCTYLVSLALFSSSIFKTMKTTCRCRNFGLPGARNLLLPFCARKWKQRKRLVGVAISGLYDCVLTLFNLRCFLHRFSKTMKTTRRCRISGASVSTFFYV